MLRQIITKHVKPRLTPFQATTVSATTASCGIGYGDWVPTMTSANAGRITLTPKEPYTRTSLVFATPHIADQITVGGYASIYDTDYKSSFRFRIRTGLGSDGNGTMDGFAYGWDSSDLSICKAQRVAATNEAPRLIWGKITGSSGAVAIGSSDFSCTRTGTGVYNITFKKAFAVTPIVVANCIGTSATVASNAALSNKTASGVTISIGDESESAADADFYIVVEGSDARSDSAKGRLPIENSQRKPRIVGCQLSITAGVPSFAVGGTTGGADFGTLVDVGTGSMSVLISELYKREPAILVSSSYGRTQISSYSSGVITVLTKDSSGNNADQDGGVVNILCIGSDDVSQY